MYCRPGPKKNFSSESSLGGSVSPFVNGGSGHIWELVIELQVEIQGLTMLPKHE